MAKTISAKVRKAVSPGKKAETDLRMKIQRAADRYTDAMVDLGFAKTVGLSEVVESGFNRLEAKLRRGGSTSVGTFHGATNSNRWARSMHGFLGRWT